MVIVVQRHLPQYDQEQLFRIAADVESYPRFLFWCRNAKIKRKTGNHLDVDNVFAVGPIRTRFETHAVLDPPRSIEISSTDGPFKRLRITWTFTPAKTGGTRVTLSIEQEFRRRFFETAVRPFTRNLENALIDAFAKRAREFYGTRGDITPRQKQ